MTKSKLDISVPTALSPPLAIIVDGNIGGVGKSTASIHINQAFQLSGLPLDAFEIDDQAKLARFIGTDRVTALNSQVRDPNGDHDVAAIFAPVHSAFVAMPETGRSMQLDLGGSQTGLFNAFISEVDLEEDITTLNLTIIVCLVLVASEESTRQVLLQLKNLRRLLPSAKVVLILNERDGCPLLHSDALPPELAAALQKAASVYPTIRLPRLRNQSRRLFETLGLMPADIVSWHRDHYAVAMRRTGLPLLFAKRFVKDIAAWSHDVHHQFSRIIPALGGQS